MTQTPTDIVREALKLMLDHLTVNTVESFGTFEKTGYESHGLPIYRAEITKAELLSLARSVDGAMRELEGKVLVPVKQPDDPC